MDSQMKLELRRNRVRLVEDAPARRRAVLIPDEFSPELAPAQLIKRRSLVAPPDVTESILNLPVTDWFDTSIPPTMEGEYEMRPFKNDKKIFKAHYSLFSHGWTSEHWPFPAVIIDKCEWRGLAVDPSKR